MNQRKSDSEPPAPRWRDYVPIQPAAELFPSLTNAELRELGENIKANSLQHKVIVEPRDDGSLMLLDGRGRLDAMELLGIPSLKTASSDRSFMNTRRSVSSRNSWLHRSIFTGAISF